MTDDINPPFSLSSITPFKDKNEYIKFLKSLDLSKLPSDKVNMITSFLEGEAIERAREDYYAFVHLIGPTRIDGFKTGRHIQIICGILQKLASSIWGNTGYSHREMINLCPGGMKSELCTRMYAAWLLGKYPKIRLILVGYGLEFARDEFGAKILDILRSDEYQRIFPGTALREDKQTAGRFLTKGGGEMVCTSLVAKTAGRRAHMVIADDAIVEQDAYSATVRKQLVEGYVPNIRSRLLMSPDGGELLVGTVWCDGDLFSTLAEDDKNSGAPWNITRIPAILDEEASQLLRKEGDPEGYLTPGSSFWPEFQPLSRLESIRSSLSGNISRWNAVYLQALDVNTPIPTPTGWSTIGDLKIGDYVLSDKGLPIKVINKTEPKISETYTVTTKEGYSVIADKGHLWKVKLNRRSDPYRIKTTEEIYTAKHIQCPAIPTCQPIELPEIELEVDPYIFGLWLGDGNRSQGIINSGAEDLKFYWEEIIKAGYTPTVQKDVQTVGVTGDFRVNLRKIGALYTKKVPLHYLRASREQRLALLQGLMDTDGTCDNGQSIFANTDPHLIEVVKELVLSLGRKPLITSFQGRGHREREWFDVKEYKRCYKVHFYMEDAFRLPRKRVKARNAFTKTDRFITISPSEPTMVQCITVDSEDGLFLAGKGYMVTHNCPTPEQGIFVSPGDFNEWKESKPPKIESIIISSDTAFTTNTWSDYTDIQIWGFFRRTPEHDEMAGKTSLVKRNCLLLGASKGKWNFPDLCDKFEELYQDHNPDFFLIENRASGLSLLPELEKRGIPVRGWKTEKDKILKAHAATPLIKSGILWVPKPKDKPHISEKTQEWISDVCKFPKGKHDDTPDNLFQFVLFCREQGLLEGESYSSVTDDFEDEDEDFRSSSQGSYTAALLKRGR